MTLDLKKFLPNHREKIPTITIFGSLHTCTDKDINIWPTYLENFCPNIFFKLWLKNTLPTNSLAYIQTQTFVPFFLIFSGWKFFTCLPTPDIGIMCKIPKWQISFEKVGRYYLTFDLTTYLFPTNQKHCVRFPNRKWLWIGRYVLPKTFIFLPTFPPKSLYHVSCIRFPDQKLCRIGRWVPLDTWSY